MRAACARVATRSRWVHLDASAIESYAGTLEPMAETGLDPSTHIVEGARELRAAFVLCLGAINFGSGWWPTIRKRPGHSGYFTIAAGLADRFRAAGAWSPRELAQISAAEIAGVVGHQPEHPLMGQFAASLRDVGEHVGTDHGGRYAAVAEAAGGSAVVLAGILANWRSFADVSQYEGAEVPFFKRAQLVPTDLDRNGVAPMRDQERLTAFADNLVPHVLRLDGVLRLEPQLVARIDAGELLTHGAAEEVELRACAVHAVELLAGGNRSAPPPGADRLDPLEPRPRRPLQGGPTAPLAQHRLLNGLTSLPTMSARAILVVTALIWLALPPAADAAFAGRNGPILFRSDAGNVAGRDSHAIWMVGPDGRGAKRVTRGADPRGLEIDYSPVVFPDGRRFAYVRQVAGNDFAVQNQIYVKPLAAPASALGSPVLPEPVDYRLLSVGISPDGERLALAAEPPPLEVPQVLLVELGSAEMSQVTHGTIPASAPEFSPDGRRIVFARRTRRPGAGIFTVGLDGSGLRELTSRHDGAPSFSPSGRLIVFNRSTRRGISIFSMRADGSRVKRLTDGDFFDRGPVFSPNGRRILFARAGHGRNPDLYTIRAGGGALRLLYASRGELFSDFGPDWGPKPR